jgi:hypothetical protein
MKFWVLDPKSGKPSVTLSLMVLGFCVATFKLLVSGMTIHGIAFESFSGTDFAMVVGALGALYSVKKFTNKDSAELKKNKPPVEGPGE